MIEKTCPECGSQKVVVIEETMFMVNTGDHYCCSVKAHDSDATAKCLDCNWTGKHHQLDKLTVPAK